MIVIGYDPKRGEGWLEIGDVTLPFHSDRLVLKVYGREALFIDTAMHEKEVTIGFKAPPDEPQIASLQLVAPATWRTAGLGAQ